MNRSVGFFMVCFDIRDEKRLVRVSDTLENFGQRVQRSVFECYLEADDLDRLKSELERLIDKKEDQVRYYFLCPKDVKRILIDGPGEVSINADFLIV